MAKLVDAADLKSAGRKAVGVQVPLPPCCSFRSCWSWWADRCSRPSCCPNPRAHLAPLPQPPPGRYTVLVADWGHHTSIVVQQPPGWRLGPPGAEAAPFLEVAWGDRRYFHARDRSPQALVAALFLPTD